VILNRGDGAANGLTGVLRSLNPNAVSVVDSLGSFGSVAAGDSGQNTGDRFTVHANAGVGVGRRFTLRVVLRTSDGAEVNWDFPVTVGEPIPSAPLGPDHYGYYAYDDTDAGYGERPSYDWVEVDPNYGGSGTRLSLTNDTCMPVGLPFNFRFYGRDNWAVSVSDNGFLAPGSQWIGDIYNWRLPSPSGTDGTIAAFWDDFRTDTLGASGVYTYHDAANHRFIIEWSRCVHVHGFRPPSYGELQSFEAVLLDPQFYPTRTGDAPVVFQYLMVVNDDTIGVTTPDPNCHNYATVGIESPDNSCGLEYTYANSYPAAAAVVANGRAIRFTTNPPDTFVAVAEMRDPGLYTALRVVPRPAVQQVRIEAYPAAEEGRVSIYDVGGRMVTRFTVGPGDASHEWRLVDLKGQRVRAGVYQAVLTRATDGTRISADRIVILEQP
jgi:hypothetical protein